MTDDAVVRDAAAEDVAGLERVLPSGGDHARQLANAAAGRRDLLVVVCGGEPVGTVVVRWTGMDVGGGRVVPEIGSLSVAPRWRGRGLATRLVATAERRVRVRGGQAAAMAVAETNEGALRHYLRLGYRDSGRRRAAWGPGARRADVAAERVLVKDL